jgi:dTDP-4-amino-4,6-dideoxygalactose transaminase
MNWSDLIKMNNPWKIPLSDMTFDRREEMAVSAVVKSKWLSLGPVTLKFEEAFARKHCARHAIAVTNCTAALHLAYLALGIGKGDEVICPSLTFVATVNAILYTGATPVFADIISDSDLNISYADIERKITRRTKAIAIVHYGGYPCDMPKIAAIAGKHDLRIIEDCAHAPLTRFGSHYLGTFGDIGCFSFFSNKNMTTGEGGMILTASDDSARAMRLLRSHGMTTMTLDRHKGHAYTYDVIALGYNYRIDEIRSALGLVQLSKLARLNDVRRKLVRYYRKALKPVKGLQVCFSGHDLAGSACHIFPVTVGTGEVRDSLQRHLKDAGVQTSIHYPPTHTFSYYRKRFGRVSLPRTDDVASRVLTLPLYPKLKTSEIDYIVSCIKDFFR